MCPETYVNNRVFITKALRIINTMVMEEAGKVEAELALKEGRTIQYNGKIIACIDVEGDSSWGQRSYNGKHDSKGGFAAIIVTRTKKILWMAVKNKYCYFCTKAEMKNMIPGEHECFKNREGSSSGMEKAIILEGFSKSMPMHGLIFGRYIGDNDSSVYHGIKIKNFYEEYKVEVEKIECTSHLGRN